jgi:hypothetical protein
MTLQLKPIESVSCRHSLMDTFDDLLPITEKAGLSLVSFDDAIEERSSLVHWVSRVTNLFLGRKLAKLAVVIIGDYRVLTVLTLAGRTFDSETSDRPFLVAVTCTTWPGQQPVKGKGRLLCLTRFSSSTIARSYVV